MKTLHAAFDDLSQSMQTDFLSICVMIQGTSLHVHKSLIFDNEGDFGVNISLI